MAHPLSSVPILLNIYFGKQLLSKATGFFYEKNKNLFLITNKHNVTGKNIFTDEYISPTGAIPNKFIFSYRYYASYNEQEILIERQNLTVDLLNFDEIPLWYTHPEKNVDIAVIPLDSQNIHLLNILPLGDIELEKSPVYLNSITFNNNLLTSVSDDVYVVGYPYGRSSTNIELPIWKRGTVASEPDLNHFGDNREVFLIDTTTRTGMSGSPVFAVQHGTVTTKDGHISMGPINNINFLGIYSGRVDGISGQDSYIGLVWRQEIIDEIIQYYFSQI